jgi:hypothetical protein
MTGFLSHVFALSQVVTMKLFDGLKAKQWQINFGSFRGTHYQEMGLLANSNLSVNTPVLPDWSVAAPISIPAEYMSVMFLFLSAYLADKLPVPMKTPSKMSHSPLQDPDPPATSWNWSFPNRISETTGRGFVQV